MKYKVRFNYHFEVEVSGTNLSPEEIYKLADGMCPDSWEDPDLFCDQLIYDNWEYKEVQ